MRCADGAQPSRHGAHHAPPGLPARLAAAALVRAPAGRRRHDTGAPAAARLAALVLCCTAAQSPKRGGQREKRRGRGLLTSHASWRWQGGYHVLPSFFTEFSESLVREILRRFSGIEFPTHAHHGHPGCFRAGLVERSNVMWRLRLCILFFRKSLNLLQHHPSSNSPSDLA